MAAESNNRSTTDLSDDVAVLLGHRRRIVMLQRLSQRPMTSEELGALMGLSAAATRYHLRLLRDHGWVHAHKTQPGPGSFENRWSAVPGIDWHRQAEALNVLGEQRQPPAGN